MCLGKVALATVAWLLSTYQQLMFHRTCNSMIGLPPRIQGDSFVENCVR
jgi:hypothetical protein